MRLKTLYLDVETTGLHPVKDSIHQLALIVEIDGLIYAKHNIKMRPSNFSELADDYVTSVGGITKQMMAGKDYVTQAAGYIQLKEILNTHVNRFDKTDKFHIAGYCCQSFDTAFLREFFNKNQDTFYGAYFYSATLDIMILAANVLRYERHLLGNFKLETVCKHFGLSVAGEGFHDAMSDIDITRELYLALELA